MGFWDGECCEHCSGEIVEKCVTVYRKVHDQYVIIEDVPAGVCARCGMRYFSAEVLKMIETNLMGGVAAAKEVVVPVYSLAS